MFGLIWALSVRLHRVLRYAPSNLVLDRVRTRRGLKWGVPVMLLAAPYLFGVWCCTSIIAGGGPGWLNLLVLLFGWNAIRFLLIGPISLVMLASVKLREAVARRSARRASARDQGNGPGSPEGDQKGTNLMATMHPRT